MGGQFALLMLLVAFGIGGGFFIGRNARGARAIAAALMWLAIPYIILAFTLGAQSDPTLPAGRASYNLAFGFVLVSILLSIAWLPAFFGGLLAGRAFYRAPPPPPLLHLPREQPEPGLPDWRYAEAGPVDIGALMREKAQRAGISPSSLPTIGSPVGSEGDFLFRDKFGWVYVGLERGQPMFEHESAVADQILYYVFRDRTYMTRYIATIGMSADEREAQIARDQQDLLSLIDPRWGAQFARERAASSGR